ncbi:unnamed protein product [Prunus armeniaca]|uniref:Uncharacterized protein n=1 Tax=Prunus armeniaca TaxID=36596 RepID=A0A6J5WDC5_PRUAR|nr:unnamed protein product [Prunus armeniaca]
MSVPLPNPSKRASRPGPGQRPSVDQQTKRSKRVPDAGLSSNPSDAFILDIDLDNEPVIPTDGEIWRPRFQKLDRKRLMTNEGLLHDPEACDTVLGGLFHPQDIKELTDLDDRDIALQQGHNLISSHKHLGQRLKAREAASVKEKGEISRLSDKIDVLSLECKNTLLEMDQLKNDVGRVGKEKKDQYDACCAQIFKESAKQFRFGWVQGQQPAHHRVVADPDAYEGEMGVGVADYKFIFGMIPTDIPTSGSAKHHAPPDSGDVVPYTTSHDISVCDYEIGE